jgi:hypothetical protein
MFSPKLPSQLRVVGYADLALRKHHMMSEDQGALELIVSTDRFRTNRAVAVSVNAMPVNNTSIEKEFAQ